MSDRPTDKEILTDVTKAKRILDSLASKLADPSKRIPDGITEGATVTARLRLAISTSGRSLYAIAQDASVDASVLNRFMNDPDRDMSGKTIDRIAAALNLELTERKSDR